MDRETFIVDGGYDLPLELLAELQERLQPSPSCKLVSVEMAEAGTETLVASAEAHITTCRPCERQRMGATGHQN